MNRSPRPTNVVILAAARSILTRDGATALSTRSVATEAGVSLSLIHYHFGSRELLSLSRSSRCPCPRIQV